MIPTATNKSLTKTKVLSINRAADALKMSGPELRNRIKLGEYRVIPMIAVEVQDEPLAKHPAEMYRDRCEQILNLAAVPDIDRFLLIVFALHENYTSGLISVPATRLIKLSGRSKRSVARSIARLQRLDLIEQVGKPREGLCSVYRFGDGFSRVSPLTPISVRTDKGVTFDTRQLTPRASFAIEDMREDEEGPQ